MYLARFSALAIGFSLAGVSLAQSLSGFSITPNTVRSGVSATGKVTISSAAPAVGTTVGISSNSAAAAVPSNVAIAGGATTGTFAVITHNSGYTRLVATLTATKALLERTATVTILPANDSMFIGQTVPTSMVISQNYNVTLQFKNTGSTTWDGTHFYKLLSWNPVDNLTWGTKRLRLINTPIAPGQTGTFSGTVTAPSTAGTYNFQWRCVQDDIFDPFGSPSANVVVTTNRGIDSAQFIGQTNVPTSIFPGETFTPNITFKNNGTSTWTAAAGYMLRTRNPYLNTYWGVNTLPVPSNIAPQTNVTFSPTLTAPTVPGTYTFAWFMVHNSGFGQIPLSVDIVVNGASEDASLVTQTVPINAVAGQHYIAQITFKNSGTADWPLNTAIACYNPAMGNTWGLQFLPTGSVIAKGSSRTYTLDSLAPFIPGTYPFQYRMRDMNTNSWFGQTTNVVSVTVSSGPYAQSPWPGARGGRFRGTGRGFGSGATGTLRWTFNVGSPIFGIPTIGSDGTIYVVGGTTSQALYAIDGTTGIQKWKFNMQDTSLFSHSAAVGPDGTLYIGSKDGYLHALDGNTGVEKWKFAEGGAAFNTSIGPDGTIYAAGSPKTYQAPAFYAIDPATGTQKWASSAFGAFACPAIGADGTIYLGGNDMNVTALDGATGVTKWSYNMGGAIYSSPAIGLDGTVFIGCSVENFVALDGATGAVKWSYALPEATESSAAIGADGSVYVLSEQQIIRSFDPVSGAVKWQRQLAGSALHMDSSPAIGADGTLYIGGKDGLVYALNGSTGAIKWTFTTGAPIHSSPAIGADGTLYIGSDDGKVYAIE